MEYTLDEQEREEEEEVEMSKNVVYKLMES